MAFREYLPFQLAPTTRRRRKAATIVKPDEQAALAKVFKVASLALGYTGGMQPYTQRINFEIPTYDLQRISQMADTDSYIKQGLHKYRELMWKEGWILLGENEEAIRYIHARFDFMELVMKRPVQDLFGQLGDQLIKFGNAFLVKSRGDISSFFPAPLSGLKGKKDTVVGYYLLPAETVEISRDINNNVLQYRQNPLYAATGGGMPRFSKDEIIHFTTDKKPGRAFGTPFLISVIEDLVTLRQLEEDTQNLVHRELFPLYTYKVGTPEQPAEPDEILHAASELENLRTHGGLVLPERHEVDIVGPGGHELQSAAGYLEYFKQRVITGMGLSQHHLGLTGEGVSSGVTDRMDIALYDKVKSYQRYLEDMFRIHVINELLLEGGYDPLVTPNDPAGISDRVCFRFKEIDVETQIKKDNEVLQKYTQDAITLEETRLELSDSYPVDFDESGLHLALSARMAPDSTVMTKTGSGDKASTKPVQVDTTTSAAQKKDQPINRKGGMPGTDKAKPSTGGAPNRPNAAARQIGNKTKPANQHVRKMAPNINVDDVWLHELVDLLDGDELQ